MKNIRYIAAILLILVMALAFSACADDDVLPAPTYYDVTFDTQGGSIVRAMKVVEGNLISRPKDPSRDGYVFVGWKCNNTDWDFENDKVNSDLTLKAVWLSAESFYSVSKLGDTDTCVITELNRYAEKLQIPEMIRGYEVVAIGDGVFKDVTNDSVKQIILPPTVTSVGKDAFNGCGGVDIVIEGMLTEIGERAFFGCDGLSAVSFGEGLETIPFEAFGGCSSLLEIRLPASLVTVGENAFAECGALTSVMMHSEVRAVEDGAFRFCEALAAVYFYGTPEEFAAIDIVNNGNGTLTDANLCIYSAERPDTDGGYDKWYIDRNGKVKIWK